MQTERTYRFLSFLVVLLFCGAVAAEAATNPAPPQAAPHPRTCFDARSWGPAPDGERPCYRVGQLFEDGSGTVEQTDAQGTYRVVCTLANPKEVGIGRGYRASCTRVR